MLRRLFVLTTMWVVLLALLSHGTAMAQDGGADEDEAPAETVFYGDAELIEVLRTYGLLDDWIAASPVSAEASLLQVTGNANYQVQRQAFLDSVQAWADRTETVRGTLARIDAAQANADSLRSLIVQVRDALVFDDRLATDSNTLVEIDEALRQLMAVQILEPPPGPSEDPLTLAEAQLNDLRELAEIELLALNGVEPAFASSGIDAFVGFEELRIGLNDVDLFIKRGRELVRPAREQSERNLSSAVARIPSLHSARMLASTDVGGISVVAVDAYIRAGARSSCSVDWALLAGIGQIESNHGRIGGASVSRSGQVSTTILGPLLDGGETEREGEEARKPGVALQDAAAEVVVDADAEMVEAARLAVVGALENSAWRWLRRVVDGPGLNLADADAGNGFAVVVDTDGGRLDGNDRWDRAVGPMQFLPETWSKWAIDGNGDGVSDPHNIYDAAATAGRFLCHLSATRGSSPSSFVLGYNPSGSYVRSVLSAAQNLRATSLPDV